MATVSALDTLNPAQRAAARYGARAADKAFRAGPLLIIAGAGTGKTNTLAHRVAHLVQEGVNPQRILLLTFTRRAAVEMTRRAQRIVGASQQEVKLPWSGTFHSIANRLIRRYAARVGLDANFSVLDRGDAADLIDLVRHERGLSRAEKRFPRKDTCLAIYSHRVNTQRPLAETLAEVFPWCAEWEDELTGLYRAYVEKKLASQALDYDDLLLYWHAMTADAALAREHRRAVRPDPGGRVSGHQSAAGRDPARAAAIGGGPHRGRRRRAVDLLVSRGRRSRTSSAFPRSTRRRPKW